jgi:hypothetical protein
LYFFPLPQLHGSFFPGFTLTILYQLSRGILTASNFLKRFRNSLKIVAEMLCGFGFIEKHSKRIIWEGGNLRNA